MHKLSHISGEFRESGREAEFQSHRFAETVRQTRILFVMSALLNGLFLFSDWRFLGQPHFYVAVPARLAVVAFSLVCLALNNRARSFPDQQKLMIAWEAVTAIGVALLVSSHSDIALFVVLLLPMIFCLVVPTSFRWTLISATTCSLLLLAGYTYPLVRDDQTLPGLLLALLMLNCALAMTVGRANRLRRMEWSATQAELAAREELARSRDALETIFMAVPVPLIVTAMDGRLLRTNEAGIEYFRQQEAVSTPTSIGDLYVDQEARDHFLSKLDEDGRVDGFETRIRRADGSVRDILISARMAQLDDQPSVVSSVVDITDRKLVELHLAELAMSDSLTGLANRSHFLAAAARAAKGAIATRDRLALLLIDVDEFKQVNDTAGHDAGDALLRAIAVRLQASIRPGDVVARLGGDEFAVLLRGLRTGQDVAPIVDRMLANIGEPVVHKGRSMEARVSVGVAVFPNHAGEIEELMKCADIALYEAKTRGRARACTFEPALLESWQQEAGMLARARRALADGDIVPHYQPKVDLGSGRIVGFEALFRCRQSDGALLEPGDIGTAFEHPELAQSITARLVAAVLSDMRGWLDQGLDIGHVAINLSGPDLRDEQFPAQILASLRAAGIAPGRLELEVTESAFLGRSAEVVERTLRTLSTAGMRIALDDFGTGYASLSHLKQFPIDVIKIDQRFVRDLHVDPDDAAIVRAVLNLGISLGLTTVAEGIETQAQVDYLRAGGCRYGQGYHFSKAVPADGVAALMTRTADDGNGKARTRAA